MLPRLGVLLLSTFSRTDKSIEMALSDHRRSLAGNYDDGHNLTLPSADERPDVGR